MVIVQADYVNLICRILNFFNHLKGNKQQAFTFILIVNVLVSNVNFLLTTCKSTLKKVLNKK